MDVSSSSSSKSEKPPKSASLFGTTRAIEIWSRDSRRAMDSHNSSGSSSETISSNYQHLDHDSTSGRPNSVITSLTPPRYKGDFKLHNRIDLRIYNRQPKQQVPKKESNQLPTSNKSNGDKIMAVDSLISPINIEPLSSIEASNKSTKEYAEAYFKLSQPSTITPSVSESRTVTFQEKDVPFSQFAASEGPKQYRPSEEKEDELAVKEVTVSYQDLSTQDSLTLLATEALGLFQQGIHNPNKTQNGSENELNENPSSPTKTPSVVGNNKISDFKSRKALNYDHSSELYYSSSFHTFSYFSPSSKEIEDQYPNDESDGNSSEEYLSESGSIDRMSPSVDSNWSKRLRRVAVGKVPVYTDWMSSDESAIEEWDVSSKRRRKANQATKSKLRLKCSTDNGYKPPRSLLTPSTPPFSEYARIKGFTDESSPPPSKRFKQPSTSSSSDSSSDLSSSSSDPEPEIKYTDYSTWTQPARLRNCSPLSEEELKFIDELMYYYELRLKDPECTNTVVYHEILKLGKKPMPFSKYLFCDMTRRERLPKHPNSLKAVRKWVHRERKRLREARRKGKDQKASKTVNEEYPSQNSDKQEDSMKLSNEKKSNFYMMRKAIAPLIRQTAVDKRRDYLFSDSNYETSDLTEIDDDIFSSEEEDNGSPTKQDGVIGSNEVASYQPQVPNHQVNKNFDAEEETPKTGKPFRLNRLGSKGSEGYNGGPITWTYILEQSRIKSGPKVFNWRATPCHFNSDLGNQNVS
ncbi:hypothetical protein G9A89_019572 [Geosiphon pyriformis]|nr:hypothetical protein G9A89_019572 [Geosiphon pyriformis]